jgi:hypothetical protein
MLLGKPYPEVYQAAKAAVPTVDVKGLANTEMIEIAQILGAALKVIKKYELDEDSSGILTLDRGRRSAAHAVILFQGVIYNPADGVVYDAETFLRDRKWKRRVLLVRED